jgi:hypothetical protein
MKCMDLVGRREARGNKINNLRDERQFRVQAFRAFLASMYFRRTALIVV